MPALVVRDQGYQPVLPRLLAPMDDFLRPAYCFLYRPYPKVAGLLRHDVMLYPPGSDRDNVFIVVPDSWTFLDKAAAAVTPMTPLLSTPQRQQASSPSAAFQDMRAASLSLATPGTLPLSPPPLASASPRPAPWAAREAMLPRACRYADETTAAAA
ncbi:uncharacterized protein HRG_06702 [Hirsutella rhossiliensis]|uniref:Uncharacterized protein n=1 Tax=Hirsutella rhossiliensis TaxID=111463 RepID=A0A9P8SIG6_9HYPO|nr:uncharacterized protein HRG_06702 [Hirsutella rhossiliensis]KAH0962600.1 hypothetical protein HRG_06702 [Hirsutella rhossiliensis]